MKVFVYLIMSFFILATILFVCVAYISETQIENKKFDVMDTNKTTQTESSLYYTARYYCTQYIMDPIKNSGYAAYCAIAENERNSTKEKQ